MNIPSVRTFAFLYAAMFFFVAVMGYIPQFLDAQGNLFGLFTLDIHDNMLHAFSGAWALVAGLVSARQARIYFLLFGAVYCIDGVVGLFLGNAFLDLGLILHGIPDLSWTTKFFANLPHIMIGGSAFLIGYYFHSKSVSTPDA